MGITGLHAIPMMITCMLQGTLCDTGIPCTFYGENILQCTYYLIFLTFNLDSTTQYQCRKKLPLETILIKF